MINSPFVRHPLTVLFVASFPIGMVDKIKVFGSLIMGYLSVAFSLRLKIAAICALAFGFLSQMKIDCCDRSMQIFGSFHRVIDGCEFVVINFLFAKFHK